MENNNPGLSIRSSKPTIRKRIKDRREEVTALIDKLTIEEIAERLNVSKVTIYNDIHFLRMQGEIPSKEEILRKRRERNIDTRRNRIKELMGHDLDVKEIAKALGVSISTIYNDIKFLKGQEEIEKRLIEKLENNTLKEEDLKEIKEILNKDSSYKNIIIYMRVCTRLGNVQEAINILRMHTHNQGLTEKQREDLKKALNQLEIVELKKKAMKVSKGPKIKDANFPNEVDDMII